MGRSRHGLDDAMHRADVLVTQPVGADQTTCMTYEELGPTGAGKHRILKPKPRKGNVAAEAVVLAPVAEKSTAVVPTDQPSMPPSSRLGEGSCGADSPEDEAERLRALSEYSRTRSLALMRDFAEKLAPAAPEPEAAAAEGETDATEDSEEEDAYASFEHQLKERAYASQSSVASSSSGVFISAAGTGTTSESTSRQASQRPPPCEVRHCFISYRREGGEDLAHLISRELSRRWYSTFLDTKQEAAGHFDEVLLAELRRSCALVLVLTAGSLEGCRGDDAGRDWLHRSVAEALRAGVDVVPVVKAPFEMPGPEQAGDFPEDMRALLSTPSVPWSHEASDGSLQRLCQHIQHSAQLRCTSLRISPDALVVAPVEVEVYASKHVRTSVAQPSAEAARLRREREEARREVERLRGVISRLHAEQDEAYKAALTMQKKVLSAVDVNIAYWTGAAQRRSAPAGPPPPEVPPAASEEAGFCTVLYRTLFE